LDIYLKKEATAPQYLIKCVKPDPPHPHPNIFDFHDEEPSLRNEEPSLHEEPSLRDSAQPLQSPHSAPSAVSDRPSLFAVPLPLVGAEGGWEAMEVSEEH
jgi:hypothetical protein